MPVPCWSGQLTQRRVVQRERFHGTWQYLFIESICNDPAVLEQNYRHKMMYSPDYSNVDTEAVSAHLAHCCALARAAKDYVAAMAAEQRLQLGLGSRSCVRAAHRGGSRLRLSVTQVLLSMSRCVHPASGHACQCATWMLLELARADCMAAQVLSWWPAAAAQRICSVQGPPSATETEAVWRLCRCGVVSNSDTRGPCLCAAGCPGAASAWAVSLQMTRSAARDQEALLKLAAR